MKTARRMLLLIAMAALVAQTFALALSDGVQLPANLEEVGYEAFKGDTSIEKAVIPEGTKRIRSSAFYGCDHLASVSIPGTVALIDSEAFSGCERLADLTIEDGVKEIRWSAFENCRALEEITLPASLESIGVAAFKGCENLKTVHAEKHTYAFTWAVENGYISLDGLLDVEARIYDGDVREDGNRLTWSHLSGDEADLALYVHAESEGTVSVEGDWITLQTGDALEAGDTSVLFNVERNLSGAAREGVIAIETADGRREVVVGQLPYLIPELVRPEALVGRMNLNARASATETLPWADHVFEWRYLEGAVEYAVGLEPPKPGQHGSDGSEPFEHHAGSDGSEPFEHYAGSDGSEPFEHHAGSNGSEPFAGYGGASGGAETFSATVTRDMLVPGADDCHRVFIWTYDAWDHRYSSYYDFMVSAGE